jgi:hypothetical protein
MWAWPRMPSYLSSTKNAPAIERRISSGDWIG